MKKNKETQEHLHSIAKYSQIGIQMFVIILLGVYGGVKLDEYLELQHPVFTIILSLFSVFAAIYIAIKDFLRFKK